MDFLATTFCHSDSEDISEIATSIPLQIRLPRQMFLEELSVMSGNSCADAPEVNSTWNYSIVN